MSNHGTSKQNKHFAAMKKSDVEIERRKAAIKKLQSAKKLPGNAKDGRSHHIAAHRAGIKIEEAKIAKHQQHILALDKEHGPFNVYGKKILPSIPSRCSKPVSKKPAKRGSKEHKAKISAAMKLHWASKEGDKHRKALASKGKKTRKLTAKEVVKRKASKK